MDSKSVYVLFLLISILFLGCGSDEESVLGDDDSETEDIIEDTSPIGNIEEYEFEEPEVIGRTFYIDPVNGSPDGDGSEISPWLTLQQVITDDLIQYYKHSENNNPTSDLEIVNENAPVKGGDKLVLRTGYHGHIALNNFMFQDWLTITADEGHIPVLSQFKITGAFKNFYLKKLSIIKSSYEGPQNYWEAPDINEGAMLNLSSNGFWGKGSNVKLNQLTIKTDNDAQSWTAQNWIDRAASAISLRSAEHIEIVNCTIENIRFGILMEYNSNNSTAVNNYIKYYSVDGARIVSDHILFAYNTIEGCIKVDDNHDDAIQSYSRGEDNSPGNGVVKNVVLRGNKIIGKADPNHPLAGNPQGIGCFDGFFDNWIIENNVVIVDHYHGISFYGMLNSKILNNTVIDQFPENDLSPWIMINNHKNRGNSSNCVIANNIVSRNLNIASEGIGITAHNNYILGHNETNTLKYEIFVDPDNIDFHLLNNETTLTNIIDKGEFIENSQSSKIDLDKTPRTNMPDIGAYEVVD